MIFYAVDVHLAISALMFFRVSNKYTPLQSIFKVHCRARNGVQAKRTAVEVIQPSVRKE